VGAAERKTPQSFSKMAREMLAHREQEPSASQPALLGQGNTPSFLSFFLSLSTTPCVISRKGKPTMRRERE
jgi:hypothetical protein